MEKLKKWWSTLVWWKKGLFALPIGILAIILFVARLWPRAQPPLRTPISTIPPTKGAKIVETKIEAMIDRINVDIQVAKERAKNAQEEIKQADSFDAVDAVLYGQHEQITGDKRD
jgi:hypothetical protein